MDLNKVPRWALIALAILGMTAIGYAATDAKTKVETAVKNSWAAKTLSEQNQKDIIELKDAAKEIRGAQEQFRREYREDQKDLTKALADISRAVKA